MAKPTIGSPFTRCTGSRSSPRAGLCCETFRQSSLPAEAALSAPTRYPACRLDGKPPCAYVPRERYRFRPSDPSFLDKAGESQPTDITQLLFGPALRCTQSVTECGWAEKNRAAVLVRLILRAHHGSRTEPRRLLQGGRAWLHIVERYLAGA